MMGGIFLCVGSIILGSFWMTASNAGRLSRQTAAEQSGPAWPADSAELTVAVSPVMAPVLAQLADQFNAQGHQDARRQDDDRAHASSTNRRRWSAPRSAGPSSRRCRPTAASGSTAWRQHGRQRHVQATTQADGLVRLPKRPPPRVADPHRPAPRGGTDSLRRQPDRDRRLGERRPRTGLARQADRLAGYPAPGHADPNFKWNHPSTNNAAGLLATLAEFYAGAGLTRGLTEEAATAQSTTRLCARRRSQPCASTARARRSSSSAWPKKGATSSTPLSARNRSSSTGTRTSRGEPLVAIYPAEGTLWTDHPLALLELGSARMNSRSPTTSG